MIKYIKLLGVAFSILGIASCVHAQSSVTDKQRKRVYIQLDSILNSNFKRNLLNEDSVAIYAINFKLNIGKGKNNQAIVKHIEGNDSLAYRLFPSYKALTKIDYSFLLQSRKEITLIIPILIFNMAEYSDKVKYKTEQGDPLIDVKAAINAMTALYSIVPYNNLKGAKDYIFHRQTAFYQKNPKYNENNKEIVYLELYAIQIHNIK